MTTITQIVTETIYGLTLRMPPAAHDPGHVLGGIPQSAKNLEFGRLGYSHHMAAPQSVLLQRELGIRSRLEALLARGCEAKVSALIAQMRESVFLSVEARKELEDCNAEFFKIDPSDREARSLTLAILLFRVIRPSLSQGASLGERDQLLAWEDMCREVLQQTLPEGELVSRFLEECEVGIREERLMRSACERADAVHQAQMEALRAIAQRMNAQCEQSFHFLEQHLIEVQTNRKETHHATDAAVEKLQAKVEQLGAQIAMHAAEIAVLRPNSGLESDLMEAKEGLEQLL